MRTPQRITTADGQTRYKVRFRHGTSAKTGRARQTSEMFDTEREAVQFCKWLDALGSSAALDKLLTTATEHVPTLDQIAADHIRLLTGIEEGTRLGYTRLWSRTWQPLIGATPGDQIGPDQIREAVNHLALTYKKKSLENQRGLLAGVLTRCIEKGYLAKNPAKGIRLPEGVRVAVDDFDADDLEDEMVCLTHEEWEALYQATSPHYRPFVRFLVGTGCRWGEAVVVRKADVDLDKGTIRIRRALKWSGDGNRVIGPPKTKKGKRTIALPPEVIEDLRPLLEDKRPADLIFTQQRGGMIIHRNFWSRYWKPSIHRAQQCSKHLAELHAAGCKCATTTPARCKLHKQMSSPEPCGCAGTLEQSPRIHDLRHTHASWLLANGVPIHVVQARLGHESIQTTVDTYSHLLPDAQLAAAAAASAAFAASAEIAGATPLALPTLDRLGDEHLQALAALVRAELERRDLDPRAITAA
jgi:integrase